jgi:AraC-like DNA-binding protein
MNTITLLGLGQILLFLILLLSKKEKKQKDLFLVMVLLIIGAELFYRFYRPFDPENKWLIGFDLGYWALLGPAALMYTNRVISYDKPLKNKYILHLLPFVAVMIPFVHFLVAGRSYPSFFHYVNESPFIYRALIFLWDYLPVAYFGYILFRLVKAQRVAGNFYSSLRKKDLRWLKYLSAGFLAYICIGFILYYLKVYSILPVTFPLHAISCSVLVIFVSGIGVFGYRHEGIFSERQWKEMPPARLVALPSGSGPEKGKYAGTGLDPVEGRQIMARLEVIMQQEKIYLDCDLTLADLAKRLDTTLHKLSQVINQNYHQNFLDFVNGYRIEEVKKQLNDPQNDHLKIISLAYDCGFDSKSAFYSAFKKATRMTPTAYRNTLQHKVASKISG